MYKISYNRAFFPRFYSSQITSVIKQRPILYGDEASPPVRFALMTASALNIDVDYQEVDLFAGKHKTKLYEQINPLQKVPALMLKDQVICDSHAIAMYFCRLSGDTSLYPREACLKARIDEMLFFNSGTLFPIDSAIFTDYFAGEWPVDKTKLGNLNSALNYLEFHLNKNLWLTGEEMSLSDICLMSTVSSIYQIIPRLESHMKINDWLIKCKKMSFYEINRRGLKRLSKFVKMMKHYDTLRQQ